MFGVGVATKVYVAAGATDMRKGFHGLYGIVRDQLGCDPLSGHLFFFCQCEAYAAEGLAVGWNRPMGVCEVAGFTLHLFRLERNVLILSLL
jgi:hypothetical protein